jgi:hypothetical protein
LDFRGLENLSSYNFSLKYGDYSKNEIRVVTWEQLENPFTLTNTEATTSNIVQTKNGGDIIATWATSYNKFKGY